MPKLIHSIAGKRRPAADGSAKPNFACDFTGCPAPEILPGHAYKHMSIKTGPRSSRTLRRHENHPSWQEWEYRTNLSSRLAKIAHDALAALDDIGDADDAEAARDAAAEEIREIAAEKEESASNMEDGFGHETEQSAELREQGESLEAWADEVAGVDIPELPEPEEEECDACFGSGETAETCGHCGGLGEEPGGEEEQPCTGEGCEDGEVKNECTDCEGTGEVTPEEPTDEQYESWREEVRDALSSILDEVPV